MEIARQNRTVNRSFGAIPVEIWQAQSLSREGRRRPTPPAARRDLHFSLRSTRRVNHDHPIDCDGQNHEISPALRKSVTLRHHPDLRFWILEQPPKDIWPPMLAHFSRDHAVEKVPPIGDGLVGNERHAVLGHTPGAPNGGRDMGVQKQRKSIALGFTDQQLSPPAGSALFWGWRKPLDWCQRLAAALPPALPRSHNKLLPLAKALAFRHGLLCDARQLTHVAYLRRAPLVPALLGLTRVASQSVWTRFFQGSASAGDNRRCFRPLWHRGLNRLPSAKEGYTLALDSTRLLHKDGHQEGVQGGHPQQGLKPCLPPLLAVWAEVRLVAQLWLRPGHTRCGHNSTAFFLDLWEHLPPTSGSKAGGPAPASACLNCWI